MHTQKKKNAHPVNFLKRKILEWLLKYETQNFLDTKGTHLSSILNQQPSWN